VIDILMAPFISVIIVNYNAGTRLAKVLSHLENQSYKNFEVIILDNGSEDGSADNLDFPALDLQIIFAEENLGFAAGNNRAVDYARGDWLACLNPDAYADENWLEEFTKAAEKYPAIEAFGSTQIMPDERSKLDGAGDGYHILGIAYRGYYGWDIGHLPDDGEVFAACGAAAFYKTDTFKSLGGFEERFFCYGEDVDLGYRLRLSGGAIMQLQRAIVYHEGSGISGRHSDFTIYHGHRNRIWLAYKNTPFWLYWPFLPLHILANLYLLVRAPKAGITRPYLKAMIDGYKGLGQFRADRRRLQKDRKVKYGQLCRALIWSPLKISTRAGHNWPYENE